MVCILYVVCLQFQKESKRAVNVNLELPLLEVTPCTVSVQQQKN